MRMKNWEKNVRRVSPYVPGEQPKDEDVIKLNTNENPYPPSPKVGEALKAFQAGRLRLYPDPAARELTEAIANRYGVLPSQVFVGVGSDDVLAMAFLTFFCGSEPILFPDITYSFYDVWADAFRIPYRTIPLDRQFCIDPKDYRGKNGGVVFPNPNAPTGLLMPLSMVEEIVRENQDCVVIVDEAYIDFGGVSALPLIESYDNLLVVQTFSKSRSMAGMRIGYAIGDEALIRYLNDFKYSFNSYTMDQLTLALGKASIEDEDYFRETTGKIVETREWAKGKFRELGFDFADSASNFLFVTHPQIAAERLFEDLRKAKIYVRYFHSSERIQDYLRVTIGTQEQMGRLFAFLSDYIQKKGGE